MSQLFRGQKALILTLSFFVNWYSLSAGENGSGLSTALAVDLLGSFNASADAGGSKDSFEVRETEVSFYGPIDHTFDGTLSLAAHKENGVSVYELHEATVGSSKLIPGFSFKLGQYFLGIGRLNRFHRHDWLFTSAPKVFNEFFGAEGVFDSGVELSYLAPFSRYLNLTGGVTNGWTFGHAHNEGKKPKVPVHYGRVSTFFEPFGYGMATGLSYLSRTSFEGTKSQFIGIDGIWKMEASNYTGFVAQFEAWHRKQSAANMANAEFFGSYLYLQYGYSQSLDLGCRYDYYTVLSLKDVNDDKVENAVHSIVPSLTYKNSEFASFRLSYNYEQSTQEQKDSVNKQFVEFQTTFILGAHPAHEF